MFVSDFSGKCLLRPKWGKWGDLGPKIDIFEVFSKSVCYIFLMADTKEWVKLRVLDF